MPPLPLAAARGSGLCDAKTLFGEMIAAYAVDLLDLSRRTHIPFAYLQTLCTSPEAVRSLSSHHFRAISGALHFYDEDTFYDAMFPPEVEEEIPPVAPARIGFGEHPLRMGYEHVQRRMQRLINDNADSFGEPIQQ